MQLTKIYPIDDKPKSQLCMCVCSCIAMPHAETKKMIKINRKETNRSEGMKESERVKILIKQERTIRCNSVRVL